MYNVFKGKREEKERKKCSCLCLISFLLSLNTLKETDLNRKSYDVKHDAYHASPHQCDPNTAAAAPGATAKLKGLSIREVRESGRIKRWGNVKGCKGSEERVTRHKDK